MLKPLVVVTGRTGQLGWEIEQLSQQYSEQFNFLFTTRVELDLSNPASIAPFFETYKPAYFINCAAYTAVDKAEQEQALAYTINAASVGLIAKHCAEINAVLITISTDYVFDGNGTSPYLTTTATKPINYYGYSKWMGEQLALSNCKKSIVIRTSWVYSTHGNNFVKTMLRLMNDRPSLNVVSDQIGSPTSAADLAAAIISILQSIEKGNAHYGIYQYSNSGVISWYDFAVAIAKEANKKTIVSPIPSTDFPTPAKRPAYSVMDTTGLENDYGIQTIHWLDSLQNCINKLF
jgi:dTDP-4-dehydrorhamnose reductase